MTPSTPGQIITFYSYKGGTGRTMALANIACLLGKYQPSESTQPPRVLALDWDFEAPGLHRYFRPYLDPAAEAGFDSTPGCLDLFGVFDQRRSEFHPTDYITNRKRAFDILEQLDFESYLLPTVIPGLRIMKAGQFDEGYGRRVSEFQWDRLFKETIGLFSGFADYLRQHYDYILMDSRTGMSDTSGICTMLLPDKLVVVFTPNQQSLTGIGDLTRKALAYRKSSPDGRPLTVFPLPSRIEMARPALLEAWRMGSSNEIKGLPVDLTGYQPLFEQLFDEVYAQQETRLKEYFDTVMLQHIPDYAFGEPIAVMLEETESRLSLRSSYAAFAECLTELQAPWQSIAQIRLEREIHRLGGEARNMAAAGDIDTALRIAYSLMERKPPPSLFESVADAILKVAEAAYGKKRQEVSKMLHLAMDRAVNAVDLDPMDVADVLTTMGDICLAAGDYVLAQDALQSAIQVLQKKLGDGSPAVLTAQQTLAMVLRNQGDLAEARRLGVNILETYRRILGEDHQDTLTSMSNLALTLRSQGDVQGARILQEKVLEFYTSTLGEEHPNTLISMGNLALTLLDQGDVRGARALQEKEFKICTSTLGEEHPDTLISMGNLALTLQSQGDILGALTLQKKILKHHTRILGEDHPNTLTSMSNLAVTLQIHGDIEDARILQDKILEIRTRILGEEHPDTLISMSNLAATLRSLGDIQSARALQEKDSEICRRIFGEEHPETLTAMSNLAVTLRSLGDIQSARALQEKVLEIRTRILGEEHPDTLISMGNLSLTLRDLGEVQSARTLQKQVLELHTRILGMEHPSTLISMNNLAITLRSLGDIQGARTLQEQVFELHTRIFGKEHPRTLTAMNNLALTLQNQGDAEGARTLQEKVLEISCRILGKEHPDTLTAMHNLAAVFGEMGEWKQAKTLQEQVLTGRRQVLGEKHPGTIAAMSQLMQTAKELGDMDTVVALSQELAKGVAK